MKKSALFDNSKASGRKFSSVEAISGMAVSSSERAMLARIFCLLYKQPESQSRLVEFASLRVYWTHRIRSKSTRGDCDWYELYLNIFTCRDVRVEVQE